MFYIEKDEKIVLFDEDRQRLENTLIFKPEYAGVEIKETEEGFTIADYKIVSLAQAQADELEEAKEQKLAEALSLAYEYENKTGYITFDGRPAIDRHSEFISESDQLENSETDGKTLKQVQGDNNTMKLSVELFNQSKFFQLVIGFAQGLLTDDFVYSTKEDVVVFINNQEAQGIYYAITEALSKLWTVQYPAYKEQIEACTDVEEVKAIEIDYAKEIEVTEDDI